MNSIKTRSVKGIEQKMENLDVDSLRYHILQSAKSFKTSWVDLGRALYSVWKDKLYRDWGYNTLDAYTAREIGIRKQTAIKLLKSYYFLEKEEPAYLEKEIAGSDNVAKVPSYEAIDLLRRAKAKKSVDQEDYKTLKKEIFENGKDAPQAKKDLTAMMRQREELDPDEVREKRKIATVRRFVGVLRSLKQEAELSKLLEADTIKEMASLIKKLESELG